jgi:hypothetical protein
MRFRIIEAARFGGPFLFYMVKTQSVAGLKQSFDTSGVKNRPIRRAVSANAAKKLAPYAVKS